VKSTVAFSCLAALLVTFGSHAARASSVVPVNLNTALRMAGAAFGGTVSRIDAQWNANHSTIVSTVTFADLEFAKGTPRTTISLRLQGGQVGSQGIDVEGQPRFKLGAKYVVLTEKDLGSAANSFLPIVGLYQGVFPVDSDSISQRLVVHDWKWRPVVAIRDGHAVVVTRVLHDTQPTIRIHDIRDASGRKVPDSAVQYGRPRHPDLGSVESRGMPIEVLDKQSDPGSRMTMKEFLNALRQLQK
jgi:hypothetical protein